MSTIAAAFVKAQRGFAPALKDKTNPHFKSKYVDLASCVEAVIDSLHANGIALIQKTFPDETGVTVGTIFLHESGETIDGGMLHVPAAKNDPQGYGSALTYARRYSLMAACGIAPEDDDGNAAAKAKADDLVPILKASIAHVEQKKTGALQAAAEDAGKHLEPTVRAALARVAKDVIGLFLRNDVTGAFDLIEDQGLNGDEKTYLWGMFDSKTRSALKTEGQHRAMSGVPT